LLGEAYACVKIRFLQIKFRRTYELGSCWCNGRNYWSNGPTGDTGYFVNANSTKCKIDPLGDRDAGHSVNKQLVWG